MSNSGKKVKTHYRGTLDDGTQFDSSYDRGEPIEFTCGAGQMIPGFDAAVVDMALGEKKSVHIPAKDAYGEYNEQAVQKIPANQVPNADQLPVGQTAALRTMRPHVGIDAGFGRRRGCGRKSPAIFLRRGLLCGG